MIKGISMSKDTEGEVVIEEEEINEELSDIEESETETIEEKTEGEDIDKSTQPENSNSTEDVDEVVITIGDEKPPEVKEQAPEWVRELRKTHRETQRENRELKERLRNLEKPETKPVQLGVKPKLEDYDYDTEKFEQELTSWYDRKRESEDIAAKQAAKQKESEEAWKKKLNSYGESKSKLKVKDFDDAESVVMELFNQTQQGIVVQGADNSAMVIYALGKNPDKAKEIASITDPVKFAFTVAKLEKDLKVTNRKSPPPPEKTISGTAPKSGVVDSTLNKLREEAENTGDYSKVQEYKRQQRLKTRK